MANGKIELEVSAEDADVAYLCLSRHPPQEQAAGCSKKRIELSKVIPGYGA